jgi:integrase
METSFKKGLIEKLENKDLSESSIKLYLRNLEKLNDDLPLKNFNFLKNQDEILKKLEEYKENTKRGYLISITATLSAVKDKYKNLYDKYYKLMIDFNNELKKKPTEEMTETQSENWLSWEDITTKFKELENKVNMFINNKEISENQYNILLSYMILSLYFYNPPRRNLDYQLMNIVKNYNESLPQDINYLDYDENKFYFNVFKTAKKEGQVVVDIKPELKEVINKYLKFHPLLKHKKLSKTTNTPFLVYYNCKPFDKVNSITRILNKIFDKKIGSSMLRHIYLSNKYGDIQNQKTDDAKAMSHSVQTQNDYIKTKVV